MSVFTCHKCNKRFYQKGNFQRHLKRKRPCVKGARELCEMMLKFKCVHCNHIFSDKRVFDNHIERNVCRQKSVWKDALIIELQKKNEELSRKLAYMLECS